MYFYKALDGKDTQHAESVRYNNLYRKPRSIRLVLWAYFSKSLNFCLREHDNEFSQHAVFVNAKKTRKHR